MTLQVFLDESDTYRDSPTPSLYGFIQAEEYWINFSKKWKKRLNDFGAPYFHFRELADQKNRSVIEKSPYRHWSPKKKETFLYEMALLCGEAAVPVGASYNAKLHRKLALDGGPYEHTIEAFYGTLIRVLNLHWPGYHGDVMLIFDQTENDDWLIPLNKIHGTYGLVDSRLAGPVKFSDDKMTMALQAADLHAYALRQHAEKQLSRKAAGDDSLIEMRLLDYIFRKNTDPEGRLMDYEAWTRQFRIVWRHQRKMQAQWKREGIEKKYDPREYFPNQFQDVG